MFSIKKGAMFGLDARIALAIFGALSIISGAALYSAIEQSKTTSFATDLTEIVKAYEQYVLDTGIDAEPSIASPRYDFKTLMLVKDNGKTGWNGPYIPFKESTTWEEGIDHPKYGYIYLSLADRDPWTSTGNPNTSNNCDGSKPCHFWIALNMGTKNSSIISLVKNLDKHFDNGDGNTVGNFRYDITSNTNAYIRLYAMPSLKQ